MKKLVFIISILLFSWQLTKAQCVLDRHSTNWYDGWISCNTSLNPISSKGNTHWIMYDLGFNYSIYNIRIWNVNEPDELTNGVMNYTIDYSLNGTSWSTLGNFSLNQASGTPFYEGEDGPNFGGITARYILITPTSNFGGSCFGISEVRFNLQESLTVIDDILDFNVTVFPNPFSDSINIKINTQFPNEKIEYVVYDLLGRSIINDSIENQSNVNDIIIDGNSLKSGVYIIKLKHHQIEKSYKIIKQ